MWIGDVGQNRFEEIDLGAAGARNPGWNLVEDWAKLARAAAAPPAGLTPPLFAYGRELGGSITGGYVYRGPEDGLHGTYLFADFVSGPRPLPDARRRRRARGRRAHRPARLRFPGGA